MDLTVNAKLSIGKTNTAKKKTHISLAALRRTRTLNAFLQKVISPFAKGYDLHRGEGIKQRTAKSTVHEYQQRKFIRAYTPEELAAHLGSSMTLYYGAGSGSFALVLIDIDCKKSQGRGSKVGAVAYAEYLAANLFPGLYWEASTNGNGVHGYILIDKRDLNARDTNSLLKSLQDKLRDHAVGFDLEQVEIKATCPIATWGEDGLEHIQLGTLGKLPRDGFRWHELRDTTCLTWRDVNNLPAPKPLTLPIASTGYAKTNRIGSTKNHPVKRREIERIGSDYTHAAHDLFPATLSTSNRHIVTREDQSIYLCVLAYCTSTQGEDKAMPSRRIFRIWEAMYQCGDVRRSPDHGRIAAMRNHLSDNGNIDWQEHRFWTKDREDFRSDATLKGKCCK